MRKLNQSGFIGIVVAIIVVLLPLVGLLVYRQVKLSTIHTETFKVTELPERSIQRNADGSANDYANLVYTDKGVFKNVDTTFPWKTRSSDVRNQLKVGKTYTCEITGWRIGFLSAYKNIDDCEGFKYE